MPGKFMPRNILLIQRDPCEAERVKNALMHAKNDSFHVDWVRTQSQALKLLEDHGNRACNAVDGIDAVLVDLYLVDSEGIDTFDQLFSIVPQIPILILVDSANEQIAQLAVTRGAQDYLLKGRLDDYLLPKALRNMIERTAIANALFVEKERAEVTLNSIGDAVMSVDEMLVVTYLNPMAETLTGWLLAEAVGRPVGDMFHVIDAGTRAPALNAMALAIRQNRTVGLTPNCLLIRRDGFETAIEDSAAPIHDRHGRVTGAVMVFHDVGTARALSNRMAFLAQHDSLTGLPNRMLFNDRLTQAIAMAHRHDMRLAVLFLDIDGFKGVNDSSGHAVGDRLLQSVAARLLACVRGSDTVSRQGGDEFVILLCEIAHAADAAVAAVKMLGTLNQPHLIGETDIRISASIGIVTYPRDGTRSDSLIKNADTAMYRAKECGRNNYQFFHDLSGDWGQDPEQDKFLVH